MMLMVPGDGYGGDDDADGADVCDDEDDDDEGC